RRDEAGERFRVDAAIAGRDRLEREVVDARQGGGRPVGKPRQFAAVPLGQVALGGANLLFDEIEVVEQPLGRRCDAAIRGDRGGQGAADFDQQRFVVGERGKTRI